MRMASLLSMAVAMMAVNDTMGAPSPAIPAPREPRRFTEADAARLAKAEAKRARKAARRTQAKEGGAA